MTQNSGSGDQRYTKVGAYLNSVVLQDQSVALTFHQDGQEGYSRIPLSQGITCVPI